jgi:hypothetical protein
MDQTTDPQISQITQIKIQFWNLRNLRNLRMGSVPPCGMVRVFLRSSASHFFPSALRTPHSALETARQEGYIGIGWQGGPPGEGNRLKRPAAVNLAYPTGQPGRE